MAKHHSKDPVADRASNIEKSNIALFSLVFLQAGS